MNSLLSSTTAETFLKRLRAAREMQTSVRSDDEIIAAYAEAAAAAPDRAEALHDAARFCRDHDRYEQGYAFAAAGLAIGRPDGGAEVEQWIYDYGLLDELAVNGYWSGRYEACVEACDRLLREDRLPAGERDRVLENRQFATERLPIHPIQEVVLADVLMGGENGRSRIDFAWSTGDLGRLTTWMVNSPHVELLRAYRARGEDILSAEPFAQTRYWENARRCIDLDGHYFGATSINGVIARARRFVGMLDGEYSGAAGRYESPDGDPIRVRRLPRSSCYELIDGAHRLAIAIARGEARHPCAVLPERHFGFLGLGQSNSLDALTGEVGGQHTPCEE